MIYSSAHRVLGGRIAHRAALLGVLLLSVIVSPLSLASGGSRAAKTPVVPAKDAGAIDVPSGAYGLDKTHGYVTFSYSHLGFSNPEVGFNDFDVDLKLDANDLQNSSFQVSIAAASVDSRVDKFDEHLKAEGYFDVANHPEITFTSTAIEMTSAQHANITGVLTIKGVAKSVTLHAVLNKAGMHPLRRVPAIGVSATATILRTDWGLSKYVPMVSDEVTLSIEVELPKVAVENSQ